MSDVLGSPGWQMGSGGKWHSPWSYPGAAPVMPVGSENDPSVPPFNPGQSANTGGLGVDTDLRPPPPPSPYLPGPDFAVPHHEVRGKKRPRWMVPALIVAIAVVAIAATAVVATTGGTAPGWSDNSLHVVGSPVTADGVVMVLDVTSTHQLQLAAVRPSDGVVVWRHPFSTSEITPGVAFGPTVIGTTVLDLVPSGNASDPNVTVEGLDAATGTRVWSAAQPLVLSDAPAACVGGRYFCVAAFDTDTTTALVGFDPGTGAVTGAIRGPNRNMAVAPPGSVTEGDLWQTDASTPTLLQVSAAGQAAWTKTVASLFGGTQYDPNYGWDFLTKGTLDIGSIASASKAGVYSLDDSRTLGISTTDGSVTWSVPGYYLCGGGLQFLTTDVVCKYSGTARQSATSVSMKGVGLTIEGLDIASGTTTWSHPVDDAQALSLGTNVAFADTTRVVVRLVSGRQVVLDTASGTLSPVSPGEVFWCEQNPQFKVTTAQGASVGGKRQSAPVFRACSAAGAAANGVPSVGPSTVGARADGLFIWPSPTGLRAAQLPT